MQPALAMKSSKPRQAAKELLPTLKLIANIFIAWKALTLASDTPIPMVVVTSESMEPGFQRGDLLLLWNRDRNVQVGDIPVIWFQDHKLPMVSAEK